MSKLTWSCNNFMVDFVLIPKLSSIDWINFLSFLFKNFSLYLQCNQIKRIMKNSAIVYKLHKDNSPTIISDLTEEEY